MNTCPTGVLTGGGDAAEIDEGDEERNAARRLLHASSRRSPSPDLPEDCATCGSSTPDSHSVSPVEHCYAEECLQSLDGPDIFGTEALETVCCVDILDSSYKPDVQQVLALWALALVTATSLLLVGFFGSFRYLRLDGSLDLSQNIWREELFLSAVLQFMVTLLGVAFGFMALAGHAQLGTSCKVQSLQRFFTWCLVLHIAAALFCLVTAIKLTACNVVSSQSLPEVSSMPLSPPLHASRFFSHFPRFPPSLVSSSGPSQPLRSRAPLNPKPFPASSPAAGDGLPASSHSFDATELRPKTLRPPHEASVPAASGSLSLSPELPPSAAASSAPPQHHVPAPGDVPLPSAFSSAPASSSSSASLSPPSAGGTKKAVPVSIYSAPTVAPSERPSSPLTPPAVPITAANGGAAPLVDERNTAASTAPSPSFVPSPLREGTNELQSAGSPLMDSSSSKLFDSDELAAEGARVEASAPAEANRAAVAFLSSPVSSSVSGEVSGASPAAHAQDLPQPSLSPEGSSAASSDLADDRPEAGLQGGMETGDAAPPRGGVAAPKRRASERRASESRASAASALEGDSGRVDVKPPRASLVPALSDPPAEQPLFLELPPSDPWRDSRQPQQVATTSPLSSLANLALGTFQDQSNRGHIITRAYFLPNSDEPFSIAFDRTSASRPLSRASTSSAFRRSSPVFSGSLSLSVGKPAASSVRARRSLFKRENQDGPGDTRHEESGESGKGELSLPGSISKEAPLYRKMVISAIAVNFFGFALHALCFAATWRVASKLGRLFGLKMPRIPF
ncbi:hypothetical protein BESB_006250 [Besnoitia besnoiti]|uniref:Transmembrane protein n=1 Tax=Besnoitia besnoiti TaxID=94643 RepID=A0A2A9MLX0_BESBE|nr:hypothetical protein BESB_006250 [Besnoitia besnoiti]PFH38284.1 hypothetical protein BESB_006250 [Besnoitia besnoiti]